MICLLIGKDGDFDKTLLHSIKNVLTGEMRYCEIRAGDQQAIDWPRVCYGRIVLLCDCVRRSACTGILAGMFMQLFIKALAGDTQKVGSMYLIAVA